MNAFRFLHTADLHLGTPFSGLAKQLPPEWLRRVQTASYKVFDRIVDIALEERVDFVTVAGDLFDSTRVPMAVQFELARGFERLRDADIRVFVSHGNHDPLGRLRPLAWPDNVTVFAATPPVPTPDYRVPSMVFTIRRTRVQVSGFSYGQPEIYQSLAEYFERDATADFALGLYHGAVGQAGDHANYCATRLEDLLRRNFDFWGLGHIHKPSVLRAHSPAVVYPGNPQGRHVKEEGERGCLIVSVDGAGRVEMKTRVTGTVVWRMLEVDISGIDDLGLAVHAVLRSVREAAAGTGAAYVARVIVTGVTALHRDLGAQDEFESTLEQELMNASLPVLLEGVEIKTRPPVDIDVLAQSSEFIGEFLRSVRSCREDAQAARRFLKPLLGEVFHDGYDLSFDRLSDAEIDELLEAAQSLVLQHVGEGGVTA
ncbi:MAG: metallophosphoesterase family protein [Bacilli bacterium]